MRRQFGRWWGFHRDVMICRAILSEVVHRIIAVADPEEILLFGSGARGKLRRNSDLDLLVVKADVSDVRQEARSIYAHLFGLPVPIDLLVATPDDVARARREPWTFLGNVMRESKCLYRAQPNGSYAGGNVWGRAGSSRPPGNGNAAGPRY
jgi:predicted nucleotidyltransferase